MKDGHAPPGDRPWDPSEPNAIDCLQVIYKVAERCNLKCSYCYYYFMGDETALERPAKASLNTSRAFGQWLADGARELGVRTVHISFHGGEPMLVRALEFAKACQMFREVIGPVAEVRFSIQTNATLLTEGWLEALRAFQVSVGVSIDGRRGDHDRFRLDHQGRSTFDTTEAAIKRLVAESRTAPWLSPGTISVIDPRVDYASTYRYLRGLGVRTMHFLLPDRNADDLSEAVEAQAERIGQGLLDLFRAWLDEGDPEIQVRFITETLAHFENTPVDPAAASQRKKNQIIVARSDGTVAIDDSLIPALEWYSATPEFAITDYSLREVFKDPIFMTLEAVEASLPTACDGCRWTSICRGGDLENRYSKQTGFDNRSVYCRTYKTLYDGICRELAGRGYPHAEIERRFGALSDA